MKILKFFFGIGILFVLYYLSSYILKVFNIAFPPAVLGLILLTLALQSGIIKESWVEIAAQFLLKNMALLFVPFVVGLVAYKDILLKNWLSLLLIIFITTTALIISIGLFVEYGLKFLRLYKIQKVRIKHD